MSARLLRLGALALLLPGCGLLAPSLYGVPALAPDVVPEADASAVVVTAQMRGRATEGRAIDRTTGAELSGLRLVARGTDGAEARTTTDARGAFRLSEIAGLASLHAESDCYAPLDERLGVGADSSATLLVLMAPVDCAP